MTAVEKVKFCAFVVMVMLLWAAIIGISFWTLDVARQNIKIVN